MFVGYVRESCPDIFCDAETDETEKSLIEFRGARRYVFYSRADAAQLPNDTSPSSTRLSNFKNFHKLLIIIIINLINF